MIIEKLKLKNFFRFYGDITIDCVPKGDKNVIVINGDNGTGKTTIINAFYWCLYGDVVPPLYLDKMANENAEQQLNEGDKLEVFVEITFSDKNVLYYAKRYQLYKKSQGRLLQLGNEDFSITYKEQNGNPKPIHDPDSFFESIIPKKLRGFFFFDGERIDRLAKIDGKAEIKQAVLDILGLTKLEDIKDYFQAIEKDLTRQQKKYLSGSGKNVSDEYDYLCKQRSEKEERLSDLQRKIKSVNENISKISALLENNNSSVIKALQNERNTLQSSVSRINSNILEKMSAQKSLITKKFKNFLIADSFPKAFDYFESKRKRGELPSDIKAQFIDDLIEREECICGRPIVKGSVEHTALLQKKRTAGRTELDDAYHKISAYMKQVQDNDSFYDDYYIIKEELLKLEQQKEKCEKRLKVISAELRNSDNDQIALYEQQRVDFDNDREKYREEKVKIEVELEGLNNKIEAKNKEIQSIQVKGEQAEAIKRNRDMVVQLAHLNQEIRSYFLDSTRKSLDKRIREVFDSMKEKAYRYARLTDDFILEITKDLEDETDIRVLSTGEGQIASLAFIGSLVSYSREKMEDKLMSDFSGGNFPIVMDSPFGNLSTGHKSNVAREIGNLASQVIIIVSDEQWTSVVEENIMPRVNSMYKMLDSAEEVGADQMVGEHTTIRRIM